MATSLAMLNLHFSTHSATTVKDGKAWKSTKGRKIGYSITAKCKLGDQSLLFTWQWLILCDYDMTATTVRTVGGHFPIKSRIQLHQLLADDFDLFFDGHRLHFSHPSREGGIVHEELGRGCSGGGSLRRDARLRCWNDEFSDDAESCRIVSRSGRVIVSVCAATVRRTIKPPPAS